MTPEEQAKLLNSLNHSDSFDLGVKFERERIIKLLSDWNEEVAIAIIKGQDAR